MKISEQQEDSFKGTIESPDCFGNLRRRGVSIHLLCNLETDLLFGPNEGLCWALGQSKTVDHVEISIHLYWQLSCCILCEVSRSTVFRKSFMRWIVKQIKYYRECPGETRNGRFVPKEMRSTKNYLEIELNKQSKNLKLDKNQEKRFKIDVKLCRMLPTCINSLTPEIKWSVLMLPLLFQKLNLEYLMAYLSTLGGAHSSLGENSKHHAKLAGKMSIKQLSIAARLNNPILASHCRIYHAHSLMQIGKYKNAANIIRNEYKFARSCDGQSDEKLLTCCKAAWARVKHLQRVLNSATS